MRKIIYHNLVVLLIVSICVSSYTQELWDSTNPYERIWIESTQITEAELELKGVKYDK
jgi:uncharacterized protein YxeA